MPICFVVLCRTHQITEKDGLGLIHRIPIIKGKALDGNIASVDVQKIHGFNARIFRVDDRNLTSEDLYALFWGVGISDDCLARASGFIGGAAKAECHGFQRFMGGAVVKFNGGASYINELHGDNKNGMIFA